jgi:hypothetical protein
MILITAQCSYCEHTYPAMSRVEMTAAHAEHVKQAGHTPKPNDQTCIPIRNCKRVESK